MISNHINNFSKLRYFCITIRTTSVLVDPADSWRISHIQHVAIGDSKPTKWKESKNHKRNTKDVRRRLSLKKMKLLVSPPFASKSLNMLSKEKGGNPIFFLNLINKWLYCE